MYREVTVRVPPLLKQAFVILSALFLLGYLLLTRALWFSDLERQAKIGIDRLSKPIDVSRAEKVTWKIRRDYWKYTGECHVALVLDRRDDIPSDSYRKGSMTLRVKADAYAITYEPAVGGKVIEGFQAPRLIRNSYFKTDDPLSPDAAIWQAWGDSVELGLCGLNRYPFEDTYIVVEITRPDPVLAKAHPRLQIFGEHDYAVYEHLPMLRILRDSILAFLALCVIGLSYSAFKRVK